MAVLTIDHSLLLYLAVGFGLWMAWSVGANDFSNAAAPAIGAKVLSVREAIFIAVVFEFGGAMFYGANVTHLPTKEIIDLAAARAIPGTLVLGMLASLLAAATWISFATLKGWPVSTTYSIIGAMMGFALVALGSSAVRWGNVGAVVASWAVSPLVGGLLAFALAKSIRWLILGRRDPARCARRWAPLYVFLAAFVVFLMTFLKSMKPLGLELSDQQYLILAAGFGLGLTVMGTLIVHGRRPEDVEGTFIPMTLFTLCSMAFAHGVNDVANAAGPVAVILDALGNSRGGPASAPPLWLFALAGIGIALGCASLGPRVSRTLSEHITELTASSAFCVSLASTATVVLTAQSGFPVSTTQTVVGAIVGVGLAGGGVAAVRFSTIGTIVNAWIGTLPATALLSALLYLLLRVLFGI